jgi:peptidoglycan-associated lipoprotein
MNQYRVVLISLLAAAFAGCASNIPDPEPTTGATDAGSDADTGGYDTSAGDQGEFFGDDRGDGELGMVIYFDFDQADLKPEYADLLAQHANRLSNGSRTKVRLEGHADERGSREYNVGLGERRSQAVRRMLLVQGASTNQLLTVSFGEERPATLGSEEDSYALNRRVEIKYLN